MSLLPSGAIETGGYDINNSLRFRSSASATLTRTTSAGSSTTATWSFWMKRGTLSGRQVITGWSNAVNTAVSIEIDTNNNFKFGQFAGSDVISKVTSQVFRDPSAWYHIVVTLDTTNATAEDRARIYVNGSRVINWTTNTNPSLNYATSWGSSLPLTIGNQTNGVTYFDGYLAEYHFIDGSAKTPSDFGETDTTTGVWKPKKYTGTYGTNGFYLKFSDIATTSGSNAGLGKDFSGNSNYWTTNNISVTSGTTYDAMTDSPTNTSATVANYAVLNPLDKGTSITSSAGNLNLANGNAGNFENIRATFGMSAGKWYIEYVVNTWGANTRTGVGMGTSTLPLSGNFPGFYTNGWAYLGNGSAYTNNVATSLGTGTYTTGDVIMLAFDADNGNLWFGKNGTWNGAPASGTGATYTGLTSGPYFFTGWAYNTSDSTSANFGQRPFAYTPPTGFKALNTFNLPAASISNGAKHFAATTYTGNGGTQTVSNGNFQPDFVWIKNRAAAVNHQLHNSNVGWQYGLNSNNTNAEYTDANAITGATSTGWSMNNNYNSHNQSGVSFIGWQWQAGQGSTSSNTSGSITSTVSVNTTAGFSVVTWTATNGNATIGHGLGVAPKMIIIKDRATAANWTVYHASVGNTAGLVLNDTSASNTNANFWNNTTPTSTVFSVGSFSNYSTDAHVAYCWAAIPGYSAFTSYTGNGSTDGPFVYLGFRPKFVMIKSSSNSNTEWLVWDSSRNQYNSTNSFLYPNQNYDEYTGSAADLDFLSNGFKLRNANAGTASSNQSGYTYIVAAWAENPFKNSLAR